MKKLLLSILALAVTCGSCKQQIPNLTTPFIPGESTLEIVQDRPFYRTEIHSEYLKNIVSATTYGNSEEVIAEIKTDENGVAVIVDPNINRAIPIVVLNEYQDPLERISVNYASSGTYSLIAIYDPLNMYEACVVLIQHQDLLSFGMQNNKDLASRLIGANVAYAAPEEAVPFVLAVIIIIGGASLTAGSLIETALYKDQHFESYDGKEEYLCRTPRLIQAAVGATMGIAFMVIPSSGESDLLIEAGKIAPPEIGKGFIEISMDEPLLMKKYQLKEGESLVLIKSHNIEMSDGSKQVVIYEVLPETVGTCAYVPDFLDSPTSISEATKLLESMGVLYEVKCADGGDSCPNDIVAAQDPPPYESSLIGTRRNMIPMGMEGLIQKFSLVSVSPEIYREVVLEELLTLSDFDDESCSVQISNWDDNYYSKDFVNALSGKNCLKLEVESYDSQEDAWDALWYLPHTSDYTQVPIGDEGIWEETEASGEDGSILRLYFSYGKYTVSLGIPLEDYDDHARLIEFATLVISRLPESDPIYPEREFIERADLILVSVIGARTEGLYVANLKTFQMYEIVDSMECGPNCSGSFSPDGMQIVYGGISGIWTSKFDGRSKKILVNKLTHNELNYFARPKWSSRGDTIAFVCGTTGETFFSPGIDNNQICLVNSDGSNLRVLSGSRTQEEIQDLFWSSDANRIYFYTGPYRHEISDSYEIDLKTGDVNWLENKFTYSGVGECKISHDFENYACAVEDGILYFASSGTYKYPFSSENEWPLSVIWPANIDRLVFTTSRCNPWEGSCAPTWPSSLWAYSMNGATLMQIINNENWHKLDLDGGVVAGIDDYAFIFGEPSSDVTHEGAQGEEHTDADYQLVKELQNIFLSRQYDDLNVYLPEDEYFCTDGIYPECWKNSWMGAEGFLFHLENNLLSEFREIEVSEIDIGECKTNDGQIALIELSDKQGDFVLLFSFLVSNGNPVLYGVDYTRESMSDYPWDLDWLFEVCNTNYSHSY